VVYSKIEHVSNVDEIAHPAVRGSLKMLGLEKGLEIQHYSDIPARSGMGSSSAFAVGLLHALHGLVGKIRSREDLAVDAIRLEQDVLGETVGVQDQIAAAFGGLNRIRLMTNGSFIVEPICISPQRRRHLESHLLLFFTGISRTASEIATNFVKSVEPNAATIHQMVEMVDQAVQILAKGSLTDFGLLLDEAWQRKRSINAAVSTIEVDAVYNKAKDAGALGGKLLGAGGGGFMLIFAEPEKHPKILHALRDLLHVPFALDNTGSQVLIYTPEESDI
jgi:D-glycero-alpha-D-manno-heptose-7-phosphate kinase